jgi:hypothetical protein
VKKGKLKQGEFKTGSNKKSPRSTRGIIYIDGLVSTGNKFPDTILKRILSNQKKFPKYFIHILNITVDKGGCKPVSISCK